MKIEQQIGICGGEQYAMLLIKNLETPRLTIRSWQKSDKDFTLSLWGDKENGKLESNKRMWLYEKIHISILGNRVSVTYSKEV